MPAALRWTKTHRQGQTLHRSPSTISFRKSRLCPLLATRTDASAQNVFKKNCFAQMAAAERSAAQQRLIALLGPGSRQYLSARLAETDRSLTRQVRELFALIREYGPEAVAERSPKPMLHALSAPIISPISSVSNSCAATFSRRYVFKDPALNELATDPLSLADIRRFHSSFPKGVP